jgi:hypothetical protein
MLLARKNSNAQASRDDPIAARQREHEAAVAKQVSDDELAEFSRWCVNPKWKSRVKRRKTVDLSEGSKLNGAAVAKQVSDDELAEFSGHSEKAATFMAQQKKYPPTIPEGQS